ncbi:MAG: hypothetical protein Q8K63_15745 [Acidimicrobiales bacterium]|nr:hypothetical protein [Acidimicrobiales bacterium]
MTTEFGEKTFHLGNLVGVRDAAGNVLANWATRGQLPTPAPTDLFSWQGIKASWMTVSAPKLVFFVAVAICLDLAAFLLPLGSFTSGAAFFAITWSAVTIVMLVLNGPRLWRER